MAENLGISTDGLSLYNDAGSGETDIGNIVRGLASEEVAEPLVLPDAGIGGTSDVQYMVDAVRFRDQIQPISDYEPSGRPSFGQSLASQQNQFSPAQEVARGASVEDYDVLGAEIARLQGEVPESKPTGDVSSQQKTSGLSASQLAGSVADVSSSLSQTMANQALSDYANELAAFEEQGKYWFNPQYDSKPELDEYLAELPSMQDAMVKSSYASGLSTAGDNSGGSVAAGFIDPISAGLSYAIAGKEEGAQLQGYMMQKVGERGLEGFSATGSPWGLLFGVVGAVEAIVTWNDVKEKDAKAKREAQKKYYKMVRRYNLARTHARALAANEYAAKRSAINERLEREELQEKGIEFQEKLSRKNAIMQFVESARAAPEGLLTQSTFRSPGR